MRSLNSAVTLYNKWSVDDSCIPEEDKVMRTKRSNGSVKLFLGNREITEGSWESVLARVNQINHELGFDYLE